MLTHWRNSKRRRSWPTEPSKSTGNRAQHSGLLRAQNVRAQRQVATNSTGPEDVTGRVAWGSDNPLVARMDAEGRLRTTNAGETQLRVESGATDSNPATVYSGVPVAGIIGLGALALGLAGSGALIIPRRRRR